MPSSEKLAEIACDGCVSKRSGTQVLEEAVDGLACARLVGTDEATRTTLDPADNIRAAGPLHSALLMWNDAIALVKRKGRYLHSAVADRRYD